MTSLTITPDLAKKKMQVDGVIAAGETVAVTIKGFGDKSTTNTRLRVICGKETIAMFPIPPAEGDEGIPWSVEGDDLTCELDLFTVQAEKATRCGDVLCLFILDDIEAKQLYATKEHDVRKWIKRHGIDIPMNLDGYSHFVDNVRDELDGFRADLEQYKADMDLAWSKYQSDFDAAYTAFTAQVQSQIASKADASVLADHIDKTIENGNPHNLKGLFDQIDESLDRVSAALEIEKNTRISVEAGLSGRIDAEVARAGTKEAQLAGAIVGENQRAIQEEARIESKIGDAVKIFSGTIFQRPKAARGWYNLLVYVVERLGGSFLNGGGIVPGDRPSRIAMKADDGTVQDLVVTLSDGEYTTMVESHEGPEPGSEPTEVAMTADDGTVRRISIVKSDEEYTTIVR